MWLEGFAEDNFGLAARISVGRIEEIDPGVSCLSGKLVSQAFARLISFSGIAADFGAICSAGEFTRHSPCNLSRPR
jgi:hypothetical protein